MDNPLTGIDHAITAWFQLHMTPGFAAVLHALSEPGSSELIGVVLFFSVILLARKRSWSSIAQLIVAVPCGMFLNEWVKVIVQRPRPLLDGPFVDWSGYSFASGHTIGATLLFGQLLLFILPTLESRLWRRICIAFAMLMVVLVGFGRVGLGAHYLTDVLAAILFGTIWLALCFALAGLIERAPAVTPIFEEEPTPALVPISIAERTDPPILLR